MAQPTQVRHIRVSIDTKGNKDLKAISDQLGQMGSKLKSVAGTMDFFKKMFVASFTGIGIRELAGISDSMQQLGDRIGILSGSSEKAGEIMLQLRDKANSTKTSLDGLAEIYARVAATTKEAGISQRQMINLTEILQNTFRLSGSTIAESTATIIQLSQSFASGEVRGQELRSVMEQNVYIAEKLRQKYGQDIYKKAADGAIKAADVLKILFDNQEQINSSAQKLGQTFEQTVTVAMNNFKLKIYEINKAWDISGAFAKGADTITSKMELIGIAMGILSLTYIPRLVSAISALDIGIKAISSTNVWILALTIAATAVVYLNNDLDDLTRKLSNAGSAFASFAGDVLLSEGYLKSFSKSFVNPFILAIADGLTDSRKLGMEMKEHARTMKDYAATFNAPTDTIKEVELFNLDQERVKLNSKTKAAADEKSKAALARLNKEYLRGSLSVEQYFSKFKGFEDGKFTKEFRDGKIDLEKFQLKLSEVQRGEANKSFAEGAISLREFNAAIADTEANDLATKLKAGSIGLIEFEKGLSGVAGKLGPGGMVRVGIADYVESLGTLSSQIASAISGAFGSLEEEIFQMTKTGEFNFSKMAQSILDDLTKIAIRMMIVKPIAESIFGAIGPSLATSGSGGGAPQLMVNEGYAKGGAFQNGIRKFATGGIVNSPTMFGYGGNKTGLMGEAGTEAIMPLTRTSNGNLGVQATTAPVVVNIINNAGANIEQRETTGPGGERMIQIMVDAKVKEGFAKGTYDKVISQSFGLNRKGS